MSPINSVPALGTNRHKPALAVRNMRNKAEITVTSFLAPARALASCSSEKLSLLITYKGKDGSTRDGNIQGHRVGRASRRVMVRPRPARGSHGRPGVRRIEAPGAEPGNVIPRCTGVGGWTSMTTATAPARRTCRKCDGTGTDPLARGRARWNCSHCHGAGTVAPALHFDATEDWPGDGCDRSHTQVMDPCRACGKAQSDARHLCTLLDAGKPCEAHHRHEPGGTKPATREGCREHGVTAGEVGLWWQVAEHRSMHVGVCECCLAPSPVLVHRREDGRSAGTLSRPCCFRCHPREASEEPVRSAA